MRSTAIVIAAMCACIVSENAVAGPESDALGVCMTDFLNGRERKELGKWIFLGMSAHQEISQLSNVSQDLRDETDEFIGGLFTRLLTDDCLAETRAAVAAEGGIALQSAFELVGRVAMQELMTDTNVGAALSAFERYMDAEKLEAINSSD